MNIFETPNKTFTCAENLLSPSSAEQKSEEEGANSSFVPLIPLVPLIPFVIGGVSPVFVV